MATYTNGAGETAPATLRNYQHATRIFTDSNFRLSPKYGFLFYVEFDFNPLVTQLTNTTAQEMGMLVKSVSLPKFTIDVKPHNAYNRKNFVQNSIKYDPVNITFHDDQSDNVLNFWYDYYSYYYRDPDYADATYLAPHKYQSRPSFDWGYTPRPAIGYSSSAAAQPYQYIQAIRIYSLYQGQFDEYELINPIITSFKHGDLSNSESTSLLQHEMSISFETVKYLTGSVTKDTVGGFIDLHYDTVPSPNLAGGQLPQSATNSNIITDLANNSTAINPALRTDQALASTAASPSAGIASALGFATGAAGQVGSNSGGFAIPGLGSLNQGIPSIGGVGQTLQAGAVGILGSATSSLANGLTGAVAAGLGPQGRSILGLAAGVIANPQGALKTVENMATSYAIGLASNYVSNQVQELVGSVSGDITKFVGENIGEPLSKAFGEFTGFINAGGIEAYLGNQDFTSIAPLDLDNVPVGNFGDFD